MRRLTLLLPLAVLLAGCSSSSGSAGRIDLTPTSAPTRHARANPHHPARRTHLTRLGCIYLRERLGLPLLGSPPPPPPGMSDAQPTPRASARAIALEKYLTKNTNCSADQEPRPVAARAAATYSPPVLLHRPALAVYYPQAAARLGIAGRAVLQVCISLRGSVTTASIIRSSHSAILDSAALKYARATSGGWRPAKQGQQAVSGCTQMSVRFSPSEGL